MERAALMGCDSFSILPVGKVHVSFHTPKQLSELGVLMHKHCNREQCWGQDICKIFLPPARREAVLG